MEPSTVAVCCEPVLAEPLRSDDAAALAAGFKVLADPTRLLLLSLIANAASGEMCACDLVAPTGKSQPTVSHHLSVLTRAGLLEREQRGKWAWFTVDGARLAKMILTVFVPYAVSTASSVAATSRLERSMRSGSWHLMME